MKAKLKKYDFRINYIQNYESESESVIQGEVSMWKWMRKIILSNEYQYESESKQIFSGK